jgi:REP element-mobilizing transposase RayT
MARSYNGRMNTFRRSGHAALRRGRYCAPCHVYHVTCATRDRTPFFADFAAACAVGRCLGRGEVWGDACALAWVLMPDHAHWLIELGAHDPLAQVVGRLKSASARAANPVLCRHGALWAPAYYDHALRDEEDLRAVARYLVGNPVRAGLVERVGDYPFWNAVWL